MTVRLRNTVLTVLRASLPRARRRRMHLALARIASRQLHAPLHARAAVARHRASHRGSVVAPMSAKVRDRRDAAFETLDLAPAPTAPRRRSVVAVSPSSPRRR